MYLKKRYIVIMVVILIIALLFVGNFVNYKTVRAEVIQRDGSGSILVDTNGNIYSVYDELYLGGVYDLKFHMLEDGQRYGDVEKITLVFKPCRDWNRGEQSPLFFLFNSYKVITFNF